MVETSGLLAHTSNAPPHYPSALRDSLSPTHARSPRDWAFHFHRFLPLKSPLLLLAIISASASPIPASANGKRLFLLFEGVDGNANPNGTANIDNVILALFTPLLVGPNFRNGNFNDDTATFEIPSWDNTKDTPYRLGVQVDGSTYYWPGTIPKNPVDKNEIVVINTSCQRIATLVHHGIDGPADASYSFTSPAISNFFPRT